MKKDIEKALMEFLMDVRTTGEERKRGIPLITFVYKEEDRAVLFKALPLPLADIQPDKKRLVGKELLYRVDFFREGEAKVCFGILPVVRKSAPFLTLLEDAVKSGDRKAGYPWLCDYLKFHSAYVVWKPLPEGNYPLPERKGQELRTGIPLPTQRITVKSSPMCVPAWIQRPYDSDIGRGEVYAGGTGVFYQQEQGKNSVSGSKSLTASGILHVKEQPHVYRQETQRPSAYHENIIKAKETVLHRKADTVSGFSRKGKYLKSRKQYPKGSEAQEKSDTGRKETGKGAGAERIQKAYLEEGVRLPVMKNTAGESISPKADPSSGSASCLRIRNASDSIRQRDGKIPGRKETDGAGRKGGKSGRDGKKGKSGDKNTKKDSSHKYKSKSRKDRAAAFRLLSYAADKFSQEEQKLLTSEDIIRTGIFTEEETEILRYLMSPEILENIEGLSGGYGSPDAGSLTPEEAGINLSYHGSNTAASQGKLLSDSGCEVVYEDIQPGDLIFYSFTRNGRYQNISHVAVYAGNGYLVDASSSKGCVVFRPVYSVGKIVLCGRPAWL